MIDETNRAEFFGRIPKVCKSWKELVSLFFSSVARQQLRKSLERLDIVLTGGPLQRCEAVCSLSVTLLRLFSLGC